MRIMSAATSKDSSELRMLDRRGLREGFILTFSKMSSVTFSGAGPPFSQLYLIPKSSSMPPGLCEAERMKAPKACRCVLPLSALNHQAAENFFHATFPMQLITRVVRLRFNFAPITRHALSHGPGQGTSLALRRALPSASTVIYRTTQGGKDMAGECAREDNAEIKEGACFLPNLESAVAGPDDSGSRRGGEEAVLADPELAHALSDGDLGDDLDRLLVVVPAVTGDDEGSSLDGSLDLGERVESRLHKVGEVVLAHENASLLAEACERDSGCMRGLLCLPWPGVMERRRVVCAKNQRD